MIARVIDAVECGSCHGTGHIESGRSCPETGFDLDYVCVDCNGDGVEDHVTCEYCGADADIQEPCDECNDTVCYVYTPTLDHFTLIYS